MLDLVSLDSDCRQQMIAEIELDIDETRLFVSDRLTMSAKGTYPAILKEASLLHDDEWLACRLRQLGLRLTESYSRGGKTLERKVPSNAAEMLAEGEFNRFYARGLCLRALASGADELVVYRAKSVAKPRPESEARVGTRVSAAQLLCDLRDHVGMDTALGVPAGPNSGLSVMLPI